MHIRALLAVSLMLGLPTLAGDQVFTPDTNHTVLGFKAATLLFDVPGRFERYHTDIAGDPDALSSVKIRVEIDAKSISTNNKMRDDHLRSADFFDAVRYPKIVFTSEKAWKEGDKIVVHGTLELHGQKKELQIPFTPAKGLNGAGAMTWSYKATLPLKRQDFALGADSVAAKISLKDQVDLEILLVGFFNDSAPAKATAPAQARKAKGKGKG